MSYEYDYNDFPFAYLITIRTYGTWLHGDEKGAVDRHGYNIYKTPRRQENLILKGKMMAETKQKPFLLSKDQQTTIEETIPEVCKYRGYKLEAVNAQSNHVHVVVSAQTKPEIIINTFKSYATRQLRESSLIGNETKIWARGGSRKYLWKQRDLALAVEYVLYGQGDIIPELDD